jgi:hypothetical protein
MAKKTAGLSAGLVAVKGQAAPPPAAADNGSTMNFKVDAEFRRRFRLRAAAADLKMVELLREALDAWEEKHGLSGGG